MCEIEVVDWAEKDFEPIESDVEVDERGDAKIESYWEFFQPWVDDEKEHVASDAEYEQE